MDVLCAEIELHFPESDSLKAKRLVLRSAKERIRDRFGVSIAELDYHDLWQRSLLGVAFVSRDGASAKAVFQKLRDFLYSDPRIVVLRFDEEWR